MNLLSSSLVFSIEPVESPEWYVLDPCNSVLLIREESLALVRPVSFLFTERALGRKVTLLVVFHAQRTLGTVRKMDNVQGSMYAPVLIMRAGSLLDDHTMTLYYVDSDLFSIQSWKYPFNCVVKGCSNSACSSR